MLYKVAEKENKPQVNLLTAGLIFQKITYIIFPNGRNPQAERCLNWMINYKLIGIRIAETRKLRGDSQAELAEQVNLSVPYISMIENAKKKVSLQTLIVIAKAMNTSIDALLNGNQDSKHMDYDNEITLVMKDCSNYEQRIIYEQVVSLKSSLRNHRGLLHI